MIRIAIVCGGGFSSSALAAHLEKDVKAMHLKDRQDEVDVALLCPHLQIFAKQNADKFHIPVYIIPPRLYGLVPVDAFIEDAEDILALYQKDPHNPMLFDDEPQPLRVSRTVSHRKAHKQ